jgi:hypothetical protein
VCPLSGRLLIGAAADQIADAAGVRALWSHWGEPAIHWAPGAHLAWLGGDALAIRLREHLRASLAVRAARPAPSLSRFRVA